MLRGLAAERVFSATHEAEEDASEAHAQAEATAFATKTALAGFPVVTETLAALPKRFSENAEQQRPKHAKESPTAPSQADTEVQPALSETAEKLGFTAGTICPGIADAPTTPSTREPATNLAAEHSALPSTPAAVPPKTTNAAITPTYKLSHPA